MVEMKKVCERCIVICPSALGLYLDIDGVPAIPFSDKFERVDLKMVQGNYSFVVPGLMEWYERYLHFVSNPDTPFDWRSWHRAGLLFTKQIYNSLPRCISLRYAVPSEDTSSCVEDFDVSEEGIESLLTGLGDYIAECEPVINDVVAVGMKGEDVGITVRFKIKSNGDTFTFHLAYTSLEALKLFLERLALCDQDTISWESASSDHAMYFYPQTIGPFKHMGRFHIYSGRELLFSAYINSRDFISSLYRSIMTHTATLSDKGPHMSIQSNIIDCYIDDSRYYQIPFFRKSPRLANLFAPTLDHLRRFCREVYESFLYENHL